MHESEMRNAPRNIVIVAVHIPQLTSTPLHMKLARTYAPRPATLTPRRKRTMLQRRTPFWKPLSSIASTHSYRLLPVMHEGMGQQQHGHQNLTLGLILERTDLSTSVS
jgi:hypothetical protein